jgi:phospholipid transport system substrate-binding protein
MTQKIMKKIALACAIALLPALGQSADVMPDRLVRETAARIDQLLTARTAPGTVDPGLLYALVDICEEVLPHIDFRGMAKAALGPQWRKASASQRARFTHEFRNLLVRIYAKALPAGSDREVVYLPFRIEPGARTAIVRTEIKKPDAAQNVPINYSFYRHKSAWKVYDITVDGVSLITVFRGTYRERIDKEGLDAVIADIARENREAAYGKKGANAPGSAPARDETR